MPAEVLAPIAALTAVGAKIIPGLAFVKTTGGTAAVAKGSGILAVKSKSILTATHPASGADNAGAHEALEKAKEDLGRALNDVNDAENKTAAAAVAKSLLAPFGLLSSFVNAEADVQHEATPDSDMLRGRTTKDCTGSLNEKPERFQRSVRLSTVPERCFSYGSFL